MSKVVKTVGVIAGAVALVAATGGLLFPAVAAGSAAATAGAAVTAGGIFGISAASLGTIAGVAGIVGATANIVANAIGPDLEPVPFSANGRVTEVVIEIEPPSPYLMGEGYAAGVLRYDAAFGPKANDVPNPNRFQVHCYSVGGPVGGNLERWIDREPASDWWTGFVATDIKTGRKDATAVEHVFEGTPPGWDADSKISGVATAGWSYRFDPAGERFASGMPEVGIYGRWARAYDPRLDSTQTAIGGSGSHRLDNEDTWVWSQNPALHAGTYAYGRYANGKRTFGCGLTEFSDNAISWADVAAWANVCDANDWTIFGRIFEPGNRWENLRNICAAGSAKPYFKNGILHFNYDAPRVALDTITSGDIATLDGSVTGMRSRFDRLNTIYPQFTSPENQWETVTSPDAVTDAGYVAEDGQVRQRTWPFNLVKDKDQAAQLAAYKLADMRELSPIVLNCTARLRDYGPGDCLHLDIPELGLDTDAVILEREYDHAAMTTRFVFIGETPAKHAFALGKTGSAPPTASLVVQTSQERDQAAADGLKPFGWQLSLIRAASIKNPRDALDTPRSLLIANDAGPDAEISVAKHDWDYVNGASDITRTGAVIGGLSYSTTYYVYFDDADLDNATPTYAATTDPLAGQNTSANPSRHALGRITTPAALGASTSSDQAPGYGTQTTANIENPDGTIRDDLVKTESLISTAAHAVWATTSTTSVATTTDDTWLTVAELTFTSSGAPTLFNAFANCNLQHDGSSGSFPRKCDIFYRCRLEGDDASTIIVSGSTTGLRETRLAEDGTPNWGGVSFSALSDTLVSGVEYDVYFEIKYSELAAGDIVGLTAQFLRSLNVTELKRST